MSVRKFCKELGIADHLFFYWRKRLRNQQQPMWFALVPPPPAQSFFVLNQGSGARTGAAVAETGSGTGTGAGHLRKTFDGQHALVREHLELDAFAGQILYWGPG